MSDVKRGWFSLGDAAKYAGVSPTVLRGAVNSGALKAYEKPATYREGSKVYAMISLDDVDEWVRSLPPARFGAMTEGA